MITMINDMIISRLIHITLLLMTPIVGLAQTFDQMVESLNELSLPQVNLEYTATVDSKYYVPGLITIAQYGHENVVHNCMLRYRGQTALYLEKKAFAVKLVDEDGEKLDDNLLGLRDDNSWILDAMGVDKLRMRNRVMFDLWNEFNSTCWPTDYGNRNGTVGTMVEVWLNGQYNGIYCLSDKINRKLLNLRKAKENDDGTISVKGLLYKGSRRGTSNALFNYDEAPTDTVNWNSFELQYPDDYPSLNTWQPLMDLIDFNRVDDDQYFREHYQDWYYVDNLVDYWILIVTMGIHDMPYKNTFLSTPDINFEHRYMITPWDLDASIGNYYNGTHTNFAFEIDHMNIYAPFNRIVPYNIDGFKNKVAQRWLELTQGPLSVANLENHLRAQAQRLVESGAWQREYERWLGTGVAVANDINVELNYSLNWYRRSINSLRPEINKWLNAITDLDRITLATVTRIYNYILGTTTTADDELDINHDGVVNSVDITICYNYLLGIEQ